MKVPVYRRESVSQLGVGARQLGVRASGEAQAQVAESQAKFFQSVQKFVFDKHEEDVRISREIQDAETANFADRELIRISEEANEQDPDNAQNYFDKEVISLKERIGDRFDTDERRAAFNAKLDGAVIGKRLNVSKFAKKRRIEKGLAVFTETKDRLRKDAIYGNSLSQAAAQDQIKALRNNMVKNGFMTADDAAREAIEDRKYIFIERLNARINAADTIEKLEEIKAEIEGMDTREFLPSTIAKLSGLTQIEINAVLRESDSKEAEEARAKVEASAEELFDFELEVRNMVEEGDFEAVDGLYQSFIDGNYPPVFTRADADRAIAFLDAKREGKIQNNRALIQSNMADIKSARNIMKNGGTISDPSILQDQLRIALNTGETPNIHAAVTNQEIYERNLVANSMSPTQLGAEIERLESADPLLLFPEVPESQMNSIARESLRSDLVVFMKEKQKAVTKVFNEGNHLEYLSLSGNMEVTPFDWNNIPEAIATRIQDIRLAAAFEEQGQKGVRDDSDIDTSRVNAFGKAELDKLQVLLENASGPEKAMYAVQLAPLAEFSPNLFELLAKKDHKMFAYAASIGDERIAMNIFAGERKPLVEDKRLDFAEVFDDMVGDVYTFPSSPAENRETVLQAAINVYQAIRTNQLEFDDSAFETALEMVTGGIGEYKDNKVELPRGVDEDTFEVAMDSIDGPLLEALVPEGFTTLSRDGEVIPLSYADASLSIKKMRIRSTNNNEYTPVGYDTDQRVLFRANGQPFTIQWNEQFEGLIEDSVKRYEDAKVQEIDPSIPVQFDFM